MLTEQPKNSSHNSSTIRPNTPPLHSLCDIFHYLVTAQNLKTRSFQKIPQAWTEQKNYEMGVTYN